MTATTGPQQPGPYYQPYPYPTAPQVHYPAPREESQIGLAVAALVLGILGVLLGWVPGIGVVLAVLGVVFGAVGLGTGRGGSTGRVMSAVGLGLGVTGVIVFVMILLLIA